MALKFRLEFENVERVFCAVNFFFNDYDGEVIKLYGGARPFVLGEFNTDEDLFKPIRPQQATIEILASASGVKLEDFLSDDEDNIIVTFDFGSFSGYWKGFMSQEDMQETWISTNHILLMRADDGIGRLKNIELGDNDGNELLGAYDFVELLQFATRGSALNFYGGAIISNLFHSSMTDGTDKTGLDQCTADARTFENAISDFDDKYRTIEKINRSWNQTMFQWFSQFYVVRIPEMFTLSDMQGFTFDEIGRYTISQRYDVSVGVGELVKPIMPEMIKTFFKPSKDTKIRYNWDEFAQVVCNESFQQGAKLREVIISGIEYDVYSIDIWTAEFGSNPLGTVTPVIDRLERWRQYKSNSQPADDYMQLVFLPGTDWWAKSCPVYVQQGDFVEISFQHKNSAIATSSADIVGYLIFFATDSTIYALNGSSGIWGQVTSSIFGALTVNRAADGTDWGTYEIKAVTPIPKPGYFRVYLNNDYSVVGNNIRYFKDLNVSVEPSIQNLRRRLIKGDFDNYAIDSRIEKTYDETIYFDDAETNIYKGAIYETDGITLTDGEWHRMKTFDGENATAEEFTFKRQNALAHWFMNRSYKMKLDVNLYGLLWDNPGPGAAQLPIGLINTIHFVDDAPDKRFAITNLKEIDFMNNTWTASLIEVFNSSVEINEPTDNDVHTFDYYYE
jgi:hypothetical protein